MSATISIVSRSIGGYVASERLYLTKDGKSIVKHGDPKAATLLAAAGLEIDPAVIKRFGIEKLLADAVAAKPGKEAKPDAPKTISPEAIESRHTRPLQAEKR